MDPVSSWREIRKNDFFQEFYFLSIALILAFGTLQTSGTLLDTERPVVSVVSCSMYPGPGEQGLYKGDILIVKGTPYEDLEVGETIVYNVPDRIEFSLAAQDYLLEANDTIKKPQVDTAAGKITLLDARRVPGEGSRALLLIDGERSVVQEGETYPLDGLQLRVGRISSMPIPVVHRIVEKRNSSLETKGINNPGQLEFEKNVKPHQIYGRVAGVIPRVGLIKIVAMDILGFNGDRPLVLDNYQRCQVEA